jgi:putative ABC transport system permease protein
VLSLTLGIGANTAIFQLIDTIRLRTLPVQKPQELAYLDLAKGSWRSGWSSTRSARFTYALWESIRTRQQGFSGTLAWSTTRFNLAEGGKERFAEGLFVRGDFFKVLGIPPASGRTFTEQDDQAGCGSPL